MAIHKNKRSSKAQLGQFLTPSKLADRIAALEEVHLSTSSKVLEPSIGEGAFIFPVINHLVNLHKQESHLSDEEALKKVLASNIYGVEYDEIMLEGFKKRFQQKYGSSLDSFDHNFTLSDFFKYDTKERFDLIIGNPPFGGMFDPNIEDQLDRQYGKHDGYKVKKETYSFFVMKSFTLLKPRGRLTFILSDTFLTINTMQGLRRACLDAGAVTITNIDFFSEETSYGMVLLAVDASAETKTLTVNNLTSSIEEVQVSPNFSFQVHKNQALLFQEGTLNQYITASGGMTIGKNELFLRAITDGQLEEPYLFNFSDEPISLEKEYARARLGKIGEQKLKQIADQITAGETERTLAPTERESPKPITLPHPDYCYYNKSVHKKWYAEPSTAIYWKDEGDAVYTFKKNGAWYLHGVGGKPFFKREGITWPLISSSIKARYLPEGYILDSGSPIACLKPGVDAEELYFILGWLNTSQATEILKHTINHTKNIQGKDIERMPYPWWVSAPNKVEAVRIVKQLINTESDASAAADLEKEIEKLYDSANFSNR